MANILAGSFHFELNALDKTLDLRAGIEATTTSTPSKATVVYTEHTSGKVDMALNKTECDKYAWKNYKQRKATRSTCSISSLDCPRGCYLFNNKEVYWNEDRTGSCIKERVCITALSEPYTRGFKKSEFGKVDEALMSKQHCNEYAKAIKGQIASLDTPKSCITSVCPRGCYVYRVTGEVYWNNHTSGSCSLDRICITRGDQEREKDRSMWAAAEELIRFNSGENESRISGSVIESRLNRLHEIRAHWNFEKRISIFNEDALVKVRS